MSRALVAAASGHVLSTNAPANNAKLINSGARSKGGMEMWVVQLVIPLLQLRI